jgi:hypothetical protein
MISLPISVFRQLIFPSLEARRHPKYDFLDGASHDEDARGCGGAMDKLGRYLTHGDDEGTP